MPIGFARVQAAIVLYSRVSGFLAKCEELDVGFSVKNPWVRSSVVAVVREVAMAKGCPRGQVPGLHARSHSRKGRRARQNCRSSPQDAALPWYTHVPSPGKPGDAHSRHGKLEFLEAESTIVEVDLRWLRQGE